MTAIKLLDLNPQFLVLDERRGTMRHVDSIEAADGISFLCPKCFKANGGPVGTHSVICWFEDRVPDHALPGPGRWKWQGTGYADLSFVRGKRSPSVKLSGGCCWHGHILNGEATL